MSQSQQVERLLRRPEVEKMVGMKKTALYDAIKAGDFPAPRKRGRDSLWPLSDVQSYIQSFLSVSK